LDFTPFGSVTTLSRTPPFFSMVVSREMFASLLFRQHLEIAPEGHPLFIVVKKIVDARRCGSVGAKELRFLWLRGHAQDEIHDAASS